MRGGVSVNVLIKIEKETGLMSKEVANKLDITASYYSMMRNNVRPISKEVAFKIHKIFAIPLEDIFFTRGVNDGLTNTTQPTGTDN